MAREEEYKDLRDLLQSWGTADVFPHLKEAGINLLELKMMKRHHLAELLSFFRLGTRIRFEHNLERWRQWEDFPLETVQNGQGYRCPPAQSHLDWSEVRRRSNRLLLQATATSQASNTRKRARNAIDSSSSSSEGENTEEENSSEDNDNEEQQRQPQLRQPQPGEITVLRILETRGLRGQSLKNIAGQQKPLETKERELLVQMICSHFVNNNIIMTVAHSHQLENEILQLYPKEQLENYRTAQRGEIYVRFRNMLRSKRGNPSPSQQQPNVPKRTCRFDYRL